MLDIPFNNLYSKLVSNINLINFLKHIHFLLHKFNNYGNINSKLNNKNANLLKEYKYLPPNKN